MKRTLIKYLLQGDFGNQRVRVGGWVRTRRDSKGGFSFIELNDGSCLGTLQIIADNSLSNYAEEVQELHPGSSVIAEGTLQESPGKGQRYELQAERIQVYGFCNPEEYVLGKQRVSLERLRENAHLRPRTNTFGAMIRIRNALAAQTHKFFQERDFYYINTPIITASDCEGAGEMFLVTRLSPDNVPLDDNEQPDYSQDFFGRRTHLTVSGQLEAETYASALGNVYTFGPTFRAEDSNTPRHLSEFWMIEPEMAFADLEEDADVAEAYLRTLFQTVLNECSEDLDFFVKRYNETLRDRLEHIAETPFVRLTYAEAVKALKDSGKAFEFPVPERDELQREHERYLTEEIYKAPVVVTDYPKACKAFYMRVNDDNETVGAMDVLLPGIGEIIGGSQREERLDVLEQRMTEAGLDPAAYWWYLDLRRYGTVPHSGFGLGFERLVQFCTGLPNIRDVIPFPRAPRQAEF